MSSLINAAGAVQNESSCGSLSYTERLVGFIGCFVLSMLCGALGTVAFFTGNITQFSVFFTISNIVSISGTFFLVGPVKQWKSMLEETRLVATLVFVAAMVGTLVAAFVLKLAAVVIVCVLIQYLAMLWYSLSYIPYARTAVKNAVKYTAT